MHCPLFEEERFCEFDKGGAVPRVTKVSPSIMETILAAEYEAVMWAR